MAIPYAFIKVMRGEKAYLDKSHRMPKEQAEFLMQNSNMKGEYLGACLDSCRWGSQINVMYKISIRGMADFIKNWMQQNEGSFTDLWHEKQIEELYTKFELPFIHHEICPRDKKHNLKEVIKDRGGKLRCINRSEKKLKPSFITSYTHFDELSGMKRVEYYEDAPRNPFDCGDEVEELSLKQEEELEKFEQEEPTAVIDNICYAIISNREVIMPLETTLKRLNLRPERSNEIEFPFDGWDLSFYVQKWYQQLSDGKAPIFEKNPMTRASN